MLKISVIIPALSESDARPILSCLKDVEYPKDRIEIFLVIGAWPSLQRNMAVQKASGEILYFFNSDARIQSDLFKKVNKIFEKGPKIAGAGGPDLTPQDNSQMQHLFGYAMASFFAHWKMRARYTSIGKERISNEKELLLSNMAIRKDVFLKFNGFNERLYPNEENEIINRISRAGYQFIYHPDLIIYRDRRRTIGSFIKQFYRYGQGRMAQIFVEGSEQNGFFILPLMFSLYICCSLLILKNFYLFIPLGFYFLFALVDATQLSFKYKKFLVLSLPGIYFLMHVSYGLGVLRALGNRFKRKDLPTGIRQKIIIKKIKNEK